MDVPLVPAIRSVDEISQSLGEECIDRQLRPAQSMMHHAGHRFHKHHFFELFVGIFPFHCALRIAFTHKDIYNQSSLQRQSEVSDVVVVKVWFGLQKFYFFECEFFYQITDPSQLRLKKRGRQLFSLLDVQGILSVIEQN